MKSRQFFVLSALALAASLTACGGGGSSTSAPTESTNTGGSLPVTPLVPTIVTQVPTTTYSAGSEEAAAFSRLNSERNQCGFGLLAQSVQLDAAAKSHNDYQIINNTDSHLENQQQFPVGFTGVVAADRAAAKGYVDAGAVADSFTFLINSSNKVNVGQNGMRALLSAPYHLSALMDGYRDVGISVRSNIETTPVGVSSRVYLQVNTAFKAVANKQLFSATDVNTYPCEGSSGINRQLTNETPSPVLGRDLSRNPIGGAIYIAVREGQTLGISTAMITESLTKTPVVVRTPITASNDPNSRYKLNEGYIASETPLKEFTQYTVDITGSNNGIAFSKRFNFTTGI